MDKLTVVDDVVAKKIDTYGILLIGKQGAGKTTISKVLTFDNSNTNNKICTSLDVGTKEYDFQKYEFNYNDRPISLNILDTIGFVGDDVVDKNKMTELIESLKFNFTHLTTITFVFAQNRFDKIDKIIIDLIYSEFYSKFKNNMSAIITHCPSKIKSKVLEEFRSKHELFKEIPTILIDVPDLDIVDEEVLDFYLKTWKETRGIILDHYVKFTNSISIYEIFKSDKDIEEISLKNKKNNSKKIKDKDSTSSKAREVKLDKKTKK